MTKYIDFQYNDLSVGFSTGQRCCPQQR